ncbi:MAG: hypothetical protein R3F54_21520 [Alphaproteobacteria bacterium]
MEYRIRSHNNLTCNELKRLLTQIYPESVSDIIDAEQTNNFVGEFGEPDHRNDFVEDSIGKILVASLKDENGSFVSGIRLSFQRKVAAERVRFGHFLVKIFADDLRLAPDYASDSELWISLQQTRHIRAIGKFCPFHTRIFVKLLRMWEAASSLRYEGNYFSARLLITRKMEWVAKSDAVNYISFSRPLALSAALFEEKWTRALMSGGDVSLVSQARDKGVRGIAIINESFVGSRKIAAPHRSLETWCSAIVPGTMGIITSELGDLHIILPDGTSFVKSQSPFLKFSGDFMGLPIAWREAG